MDVQIGGSGIGKSTVLRQFAALCQREITTMHLNADTDASELIGAFEQVQVETGADGRASMRFQWFDSDFVRAYEHGHVIVLDNAATARCAYF